MTGEFVLREIVAASGLPTTAWVFEIDTISPNVGMGSWAYDSCAEAKKAGEDFAQHCNIILDEPRILERRKEQ